MKIELYLDDNLVEINQDIDFVLNKQFTDLNDLTSIIVDYSKTVKVPMTPHNNELFNYVYKLEHQVVIGQSSISYDPSQKIPMILTYNGCTVLEGYAVLNSVNLKDRTYEINLYGQLGKIFNALKNKDLRNYGQGSNGMWKGVNMNTYNMALSFQNDSHSLDWSSTDWTDFFGFTPQLIGKSDIIDTKNLEEYYTNDIIKFADTINDGRGIDYGEMYVKDGFDFNQYQEQRTYMTRPYVYVDKLIQLVQNEINSGDYDGYTMSLDGQWFNSDNPYYADMCYFPGKENIVDKGDNVNGMITWDTSERSFTFPNYYMPSTTTVDLPNGYTYTTSSGTAIIQGSTSDSGATYTLNCDNIVVKDRVTGFTSVSSASVKNIRWAFYNNINVNQVHIKYIAICDANNKILKKLYLCDNQIVSIQSNDWPYATTFNAVWETLKNLGAEVVTPNSTTWTNSAVNNSYCMATQVYNFGNIVLNNDTNSVYFRFKTGCDLIDLSTGTIVTANVYTGNYMPMLPFKTRKYRTLLVSGTVSWNAYFNPIQYLDISTNNFRSGSRWHIYDILGNDFNPFTWLIDYAKKFRLYFDIDYTSKTITLTADYFNNIEYKTIDVDYSKGVQVEPIVDKFSKVVYGYRSNTSTKGVKYLKDNGLEYGDMIIDTRIKINDDVLTLSPNEEEGVFIPVKSDCLTWTILRSSGSLYYTNVLYTNKIINTLNEDNEIEYFPFYAFRWPNGRRPNPEQQNLPFYYLSDDTPNQKKSGTYTYLGHYSTGPDSDPQGWDDEVEIIQDGHNVYYLLALPYIPQFDNYITKTSGGQTILYWCTFGVPAEVYNGYIPENDGSVCVYNRWMNYLNEIFNVNNKKVTCYVRMSYPEFINFKFNQLLVIDNCTFLVNKIIDFNPNSSAPTKVELIQISNVNNLQ